MKIRRATHSDIPELVALNSSVQDMHADAFPRKFRRNTPSEVISSAFHTMIDQPAAYWLVAHTGNPIGFLSAEFRDRDESWCIASHRVCYLSGIVVTPASRRQGIARALLEELKREVQARGASSIELEVWAFNKTARQAFAQLGFQVTTERMSVAMEIPKQAPEPTPPSRRSSP